MLFQGKTLRLQHLIVFVLPLLGWFFGVVGKFGEGERFYVNCLDRSFQFIEPLGDCERLLDGHTALREGIQCFVMTLFLLYKPVLCEKRKSFNDLDAVHAAAESETVYAQIFVNQSFQNGFVVFQLRFAQDSTLRF